MSKSQSSESALQEYAFPATPLQEWIWVLEKEKGPNSAWNVAVRFQLLGALSIVRLQHALDRVLAQTEVLRTRFALLEGELKQIVTDPLSIQIRLIDYNDSKQFEDYLDSVSHQEAKALFQMERLPLLRVALVRQNSQSHVLLVTAHHSVMDGYSVGLLADELLTAYESSGKNTDPKPGDDAPLQFADYAVWLQEYRESPDYREHSSYWEDTLAGMSGVAQKRGNAVLSNDAYIESILLPRSLTDAVHHLAQRLEVTFSQVALSVMVCVEGKSEGTIGVPVACRSQIQLESLIGPLVNYLPISFSSRPEDSFKDLLFRVAESLNNSLSHSEYRYEDILRKQSFQKESLFNSVFICQRDFVRPRIVDDVKFTALPSVSPGALHELTVFLVERSDGWRLSCESIEEQGRSRKYGREILSRFKKALETVCSHPDISIVTLMDISKTDDAPAYPGDKTVRSTISDELIFPASATQERYWALDRIDPGNSRLNLHVRYTAGERLELAVFRHALHILGERHTALRTSFFEIQGALQQQVHSRWEVPIRYIDHTDGNIRNGFIEELFDKEKHLQFNLENSPLWSVLLISTHDCSYFSLTFAHSICDGWSCGILARELLTTYESIVAGEQPCATLPPASFAEMVVVGQVARSSQDIEDRLFYWDNVLAEPIYRVELPTDQKSGTSNVATRVLDPMLAMAAAQIAKDYNVTTASVYTAAYRALLYKYSGQSNLLIASPVANRTPETEGVIGPFADSLLLRSEIGESFEDALQATQNALLSAVENSIPLQHIMETLQKKHATYNSTSSFGFMYQEAFVRDLYGKRMSMRTMPNPVTESSFDWHLAVIDRSGEITLEFTRNQLAMSDQLASVILEDFELSLSEYLMSPRKSLLKIEGCTQRVLNMCVLSQEEEHSNAVIVETPTTSKALTVPDETIEIMVEIWRRIFGYQEIARKDNFFALGGHSLLLARLQVAIEKKFGHRIFAADIFAAPTSELLIQRILEKQRELSPQSLEQIIPLQPNGNETPLFMISQSMIMRDLSQRLDNAQPCFTIQFTQDDVKRIGSNATMQQVAALYIEYLRKAQPCGPYRLGGWCVSGWVAYEMASQLRNAGETVELLVILDAWAPNFWRNMKGMTRILNRASYYAHRIYFGFSQLALHEHTKDIVDPKPFNALKQIVKNGISKISKYKDERSIFTDELFETMMDHAAKTYCPEPYFDNSTLIFRSKEQPHGGTLPDDMGWYQLLPAATKVISLPGDHTGIFSGESVKIMANHILGMIANHSAKQTQEETSSLTGPGLVNAPSLS